MTNLADTPVNVDIPQPLQRKRTDDSQAAGSLGSYPEEPFVAPPVTEVIAIEDMPKWQKATESVLGGIVAIRFSQPIAFDTDLALCSQATGFVVDAERGIILTNRHVVGAGPFVGEAVMHDHEVVEVRAIYRDPIHDFGFLQFDPAEIKYMDLKAIPLTPENARVGIDVRIIGNDAGEKLSILAASISRIDRNAPRYGSLTYNDLNTFYLQSASPLSGGSSGSPVINIDGQAIGLQAGGHTNEATNFFLPLDRVKRALQLIQEGKPVIRGTIQTRFLYKAFDEAQKLGLPEDTEAMVRRMRPKDIGMLAVETVLPGGPGAVAGLEEGDLLLKVDGDVVTHFVTLDEILDSTVGHPVELTIIRGGNTIVTQATVQDMDELVVKRLVTFGGSVVHNLSYQLAYSHTVPPHGVFMTTTGKVIPDLSRSDDYYDGTIIHSVDAKPVKNLDEFIAVMQTIPDHEPFPVVTYAIHDVHRKRNHILMLTHEWNKISTFTLNDNTGLWDKEEVEMHPRPVSAIPASVRMASLNDSRAGLSANLARSMVYVKGGLPECIDGIFQLETSDYGVVVDSTRGLVVVSRCTVPVNICDLSISLGGSLWIPAKLRFLHPTHNFAIIQYDPRRIGANNIHEAVLSPEQPKQGDPAHIVTFHGSENAVYINTVVSSLSELRISMECPPQWRCINTEVVQYDSKLISDYRFGIVGDDEGRVQAIWMPYMESRQEIGATGLPARYILPVLEQMRRGEEPQLRSLGIEVRPIDMAEARACGLSQERCDEFLQGNSERNMLFKIWSVEILSKAHDVLCDLDIIISINGKLMQHVNDLEVQYAHESLELVVLRDKREVTVQVETTECDRGAEKLVTWCGATFQAPFMALKQQSSQAPSGVYCASVTLGSPSDQYNLLVSAWVTHVNDVSTPDLDAFERAIRACPDNKYMRLRQVSFDMEPAMVTVKTCYHYWPTYTLCQDPDSESGWRTIQE
ncbi:hypothetical protein GGF46_002749 [Coemansia sp. RSA 552]|nr:hypothetical protein GGF46_002749 [Coemansia sp. RSA 552]